MLLLPGRRRGAPPSGPPAYSQSPAGTSRYCNLREGYELKLSRAIGTVPYLHNLHQALESINKPHRLRVRKEIATDDLPYSTAIDYERLYTILSLLYT